VTEHAEARWLHEPGATFVTLTRDSALRGCIGSLESRRRLVDATHLETSIPLFHRRSFHVAERSRLHSSQ